MLQTQPPSGKAYRIRTRLAVLMLASILIPIVLIIGISVFGSLRSSQRNVISQMESVTALKEAEIKTWLQTLESDLKFEQFGSPLAVQLKTLETRSPESDVYRSAYSQLRARLTDAIMLRQHYDELFLMDMRGQIVLSTDLNQIGKNYYGREYFVKGLKDVAFSTPFYEVWLGRYSIIASRPVLDSYGNTVGVLAGRVSLDTLNKIMGERSGLGETGQTYLVGTSYGLLTWGEEQTAPQGQYVRTSATRSAIGQRAGGSGLYQNAAGTPVVGVYRWIPELEVALLAEQSQSEAFRPTYATLAQSAGLGLLASLFTLFVALMFTRNIATPIANLARAAQQIAAGDLSQTVPVERNDEIGTLAQAFNSMTAQLRDLIGTLEQRIVARTRALEASAEVSRHLSTILDQQQLLGQVVHEVQQAFNYYHAHIYLLDEKREFLVMAGGTGEAGQTMLKRGHKIPRGRGLVGRAADLNQPVLVADTAQDPNWLPNPLLPETRSELAVPISAGGQVVGVLDVQHNVLNGLSQADSDLLLAIANQVGVALQNARLYNLTQRQASRETQANQIYQRLQTATTVEDVLQIAVRELGQALEADQTRIELGLKKNGR